MSVQKGEKKNRTGLLINFSCVQINNLSLNNFGTRAAVNNSISQLFTFFLFEFYLFIIHYYYFINVFKSRRQQQPCVRVWLGFFLPFTTELLQAEVAHN